MIAYSAIILASCITLILGQADLSCPAVTTLTNLDKDKYAGLWYEIKRFPNSIVPGECGGADYKQSTYGYNILYSSRDMSSGKTTETEMLIEKQVLQSSSAKYDVYYECEKNEIPHYILDTDYSTYSIVWGCSENAEGTNTQRLFIYSRQKTLDEATIDKAIEVLKKFGIDDTQLKDVEQNDEKCGRIGPGVIRAK